MAKAGVRELVAVVLVVGVEARYPVNLSLHTVLTAQQRYSVWAFYGI